MATVQGLYIALLGRPADPLGLAYFNAATAGGSNLATLPAFDSSAEYRGHFAGQTVNETVNTIHRSLFNRDADPQSLKALVDSVSAGTLSINKLAATLIDGARGDDLIIFNNKLAAATAFTAAIDTQAEIDGYVGADAARIGRLFITTVELTPPAKTTLENAVLRATGTGEIVLLFDKPASAMFDLPKQASSIAHTGVADTAWTLGSPIAASATSTDLAESNGASDAPTQNVLHALNDLPIDPIWIA